MRTKVRSLNRVYKKMRVKMNSRRKRRETRSGEGKHKTRDDDANEDNVRY